MYLVELFCHIFSFTFSTRMLDIEQVVDTTGAGDAFSAGFLCAWKATGGDVQVALKWGCAVGSAVVSRVGASGHLSVDDDIRPNLTI